MTTLNIPRPDFEQPVLAIEEEIQALENAQREGEDHSRDIARLHKKWETTLRAIYTDLTPWQIVSKVSRHPNRPQSTDYLRMLCSDFCQLHGDRLYGDDPAILTGFARIGERKVMVVAHRKGRDTEERILCKWGCPQPWGYRKALKNMKLAEKFGLPIVTFVDTPGAYPGIEAEERGQAEAIARNLLEMSRLRTPILSIVIGEGGSGGALGIAVADRLGMMEFAWYSVISPEGCAAILWKKAVVETNSAAAAALSLTSRENLRLGVIDDIIEEPVGGAHRDHQGSADRLKRWIIDNLMEFSRLPMEQLLRARYERLRRIGVYGKSPEIDSGS